MRYQYSLPTQQPSPRASVRQALHRTVRSQRAAGPWVVLALLSLNTCGCNSETLFGAASMTGFGTSANQSEDSTAVDRTSERITFAEGAEQASYQTQAPHPDGDDTDRSNQAAVIEPQSHTSATYDLLPERIWKSISPPAEWQYIVLHHTATETGSVESIHKTHRARRDNDGNHWRGIGYHFVIGNGNGMGDGSIEQTFRWKEQSPGAHAGNSEYNVHGIGICLVGNFEKTPPSPAQIESTRLLVATLADAYQIESDQIVGHHDIKPTACPGRHFPLDLLSQISPSLSTLSHSTRKTRQ